MNALSKIPINYKPKNNFLNRGLLLKEYFLESFLLL